MNRPHADITLLSITPNAERIIEEAGRTCYLSLDRLGSNENFIQNAIGRGHLSIIEHASATFRIAGVSRSCTHQLVRHRLASFSQQSQRYVDEKEYRYITPPSIERHGEASRIYNEFMEESRRVYGILRTMGILKEDARFVLPNAVASELVFTANFREYRHMFDLRLEKRAQWEIRIVCYLMLEILKQQAPRVFGDYSLNGEEYTAHSVNKNRNNDG